MSIVFPAANTQQAACFSQAEESSNTLFLSPVTMTSPVAADFFLQAASLSSRMPALSRTVVCLTEEQITGEQITGEQEQITGEQITGVERFHVSLRHRWLVLKGTLHPHTIPSTTVPVPDFSPLSFSDRVSYCHRSLMTTICVIISTTSETAKHALGWTCLFFNNLVDLPVLQQPGGPACSSTTWWTCLFFNNLVDLPVLQQPGGPACSSTTWWTCLFFNNLVDLPVLQQPGGPACSSTTWKPLTCLFFNNLVDLPVLQQPGGPACSSTTWKPLPDNPYYSSIDFTQSHNHDDP
ncbi:hypothetical protein ACOMHN_028704 [Nucella lapillus]